MIGKVLKRALWWNVLKMLLWSAVTLSAFGAGIFAGYNHCRFAEVTVEPTEEVWYKLRPLSGKIEKCITQCSDRW